MEANPENDGDKKIPDDGATNNLKPANDDELALVDDTLMETADKPQNAGDMKIPDDGKTKELKPPDDTLMDEIKASNIRKRLQDGETVALIDMPPEPEDELDDTGSSYESADSEEERQQAIAKENAVLPFCGQPCMTSPICREWRRLAKPRNFYDPSSHIQASQSSGVTRKARACCPCRAKSNYVECPNRKCITTCPTKMEPDRKRILRPCCVCQKARGSSMATQKLPDTNAPGGTEIMAPSEKNQELRMVMLRSAPQKLKKFNIKVTFCKTKRVIPLKPTYEVKDATPKSKLVDADHKNEFVDLVESTV